MKAKAIDRQSEALGDQVAAAPTQGQTYPPPRILVVDDDISTREFSSEVLIQQGYDVDAAEDGAIAWNILQRSNYDLLVTDNKMPNVSGVELVKKLRAARMALPVVLASGAMPVEELNRHPKLQLAATLPKPFTGDELLRTVEEVLRAREDAHEKTGPQNWQTLPPPVRSRP